MVLVATAAAAVMLWSLCSSSVGSVACPAINSLIPMPAAAAAAAAC